MGGLGHRFEQHRGPEMRSVVHSAVLACDLFADLPVCTAAIPPPPYCSYILAERIRYNGYVLRRRCCPRHHPGPGLHNLTRPTTPVMGHGTPLGGPPNEPVGTVRGVGPCARGRRRSRRERTGLQGGSCVAFGGCP